jgi:hypothetical protein
MGRPCVVFAKPSDRDVGTLRLSHSDNPGGPGGPGFAFELGVPRPSYFEGRVGQALGWVEFSGAALFTFFVKGACFLFLIDVQFDLCEKRFGNEL